MYSTIDISPENLSKIIIMLKSFVGLFLLCLSVGLAETFPLKAELEKLNATAKVTMLISNIPSEAHEYLRSGNGNRMPDTLFNQLEISQEFISAINNKKRNENFNALAFGFEDFDRILTNYSADATGVVKRAADLPVWVTPTRLKKYSFVTKYRLETARVWLIENWYDTKASFIDNITGFASLGTAIADMIIGSSGPECKGYINWVEVDGLNWTCAVATWTTSGKKKCYTKGTGSMFSEPCDNSVQEANKRQMASFCLKGWNGGDFNADVRVMHPEITNANIWDLDCM